jgi:preprotein translocase SecE subunit
MAKKEVSSKKELGVEENKKSLAKNKKATAKKSTKQPKKSRTKETVSELKKVSWPSFATVVKNTGMVLAVVLIFGLVVFGIDSLIIWLLSLVG